MNLIVIDPNSRLPLPSGDALLLPSFLELWDRLHKIDGDRDGSKKRRNFQEIGYVYFLADFSSKYRYMEEKEALEKIKTLLKLPEDWQPDDIVKRCIIEYSDLQVTPTMELVDNMEGINKDLSLWVKAKRKSISAGGGDPKMINELLDIMERLPKVVENIKRSKEVLYQEQSTATGRKGRRFAKFEMPDDKR